MKGPCRKWGLHPAATNSSVSPWDTCPQGACRPSMPGSNTQLCPITAAARLCLLPTGTCFPLFGLLPLLALPPSLVSSPSGPAPASLPFLIHGGPAFSMFPALSVRSGFLPLHPAPLKALPGDPGESPHRRTLHSTTPASSLCPDDTHAYRFWASGHGPHWGTWVALFSHYS